MYPQIDIEQPLPDWLTAGDPPRRSIPPATRELLYLQYDILFEAIIERVYRGEALPDIVRSDARDINYEAFLRWIKSDATRRSRYEDAQAARAEVLEADGFRIAAGLADGPPEDVQRSKIRLDWHRFVMGARNRKVYGDTKIVDVGGTISITGALVAAQRRVLDAEVIDVIEDSADSGNAYNQESADSTEHSNYSQTPRLETD